MGTPGITRTATLAALDAIGGHAEPVTADELAAELDCDRVTAAHKLAELVERGDIESKRVGDVRVWWTSERECRERELERYRAVVETINDGIYVKDGDNRFTLVNETYAEMLGYSPEELVGRDSSFLVSDEVMEAVEEIYRELRAGEGETETVEATLETEDGETVETEGSFALISPGDGDEYERVGVVRDITDRKERERRLERQNKRLESFASMLAHELRNPVTIGQIYSDQLPAETDPDSDSDPEAVEYVRDAFDRIENMIDVLLVLARGREAVGESSPVELTAVAEDAWTEIEPPDATLDMTTDRVVRADETYVRHLFENLLENAVEHGSADVTITVGELSSGFYVADDGVGVPADERDDVFETGYTTAETEGGTGVGLTFVQELAETYDWTCRVTESESGGARFEFADVAFASEA
jgi:PAS domain S-box-containing protein